MTPMRERTVPITTITGATIDPYQGKVEQTYADAVDDWRLAIGPELWFQYGVFDREDETRTAQDALDRSGRRHMDAQFELAAQVGIDFAARPVRRAIDIGCGWGPTLKRLAELFPTCGRIDGVSISPQQMACAADLIARTGLADRVNLYLCNAKDIDRLPDPAVPYDLALFRGSLIHFTPAVLEDTLHALAARMSARGVVIISESLYKVDLETYASFIPDDVDRGASAHRRTPGDVTAALERNGFSVVDLRVLPSNDEVIRWYDLVRHNIDTHLPPPRKAVFEDLRAIAINWSDALRKDKVSSFSLIARRDAR